MKIRVTVPTSSLLPTAKQQPVRNILKDYYNCLSQVSHYYNCLSQVSLARLIYYFIMTHSLSQALVSLYREVSLLERSNRRQLMTR